jgi:hypothetical protein
MDESSWTIGSILRWRNRKSSQMTAAQGVGEKAVPRRAIPHPLLTADSYPLYMHYRPVERLE